MHYEVVLFKTDEGYAVTCPALPGCWSQGATSAEALENISDAIRLYLDYLSEETELRKERLNSKKEKMRGCRSNCTK